MPTEVDKITQADRENRHDRPKDAISLMCSVLFVQHRAYLDLEARLSHLEKRLEAYERTW